MSCEMLFPLCVAVAFWARLILPTSQGCCYEDSMVGENQMHYSEHVGERQDNNRQINR